MTRWAEPRLVEKATERWSDDIVHCRIYSHVWQSSTVHSDGRTFTVVQRCFRCTTLREMDMDKNGYPLTQWRYTYVDTSYLMGAGVGRVNKAGRAILRLAAIRNMRIISVKQEGDS